LKWIGIVLGVLILAVVLFVAFFDLNKLRGPLSTMVSDKWTAYFFVQRLARTAHYPSHVLEMLITSALIPPLAVFWRLRGAVKYRVVFL
jgi:hypothetical protein